MNTNLYKKYIYDIYSSLKNSEKGELNNNDLCKIFEYYTAIKLEDAHNEHFPLYEDIDPEYKEDNNMSYSDTGIDISNMVDTVVQCKLRKGSLGWKECSTFFGSNIQNIDGRLEVMWQYMMLARNDDSTLSTNLVNKSSLFTDLVYSKKDLIDCCEELFKNPPQIEQFVEKKIVLRDYQCDCIKLIKESIGKNVIINLPTGTGKNQVIINSICIGKKYLILVPTIVLLEQLKGEFMKHNPALKNTIQLIGGGNNVFNAKFDITICVNNSIDHVGDVDVFDKIFIDEAHHVLMPNLYAENMSESDEASEDSYLCKIRSFGKLNKIVYLSATIDEDKSMAYYSKDIRDMISLGHLCDYSISVPIFSADPTNRNICEYLIGRYRNLIIYCNSKKEGLEVNALMNNLLGKCSEYIDCDTSKSARNLIIARYKSGELPFLVNVRVLTEGFDAPITKGVVFMHMPKSDKTIIQIVGRALRLHPEKKSAHIILPYSLDEDKDNISGFIRTMARNDKRIKKSYLGKKLGGYIDLLNICVDDCDENEVQLRYEMIYDSFGVLRTRNGIEYNTQLLFKFVDKFNKVPESREQYDGFKLGSFYHDQKKKITSINSNMYIKLSTNTLIKKNLDDFLLHKNTKMPQLPPDAKQILLFKFVNTNSRLPKESDQYEGTNLRFFYNNLKKQISSKTSEMYIKLSTNKLIKMDLDTYLHNKEINKTKYEIPYDEKLKLLFQFALEYTRAPMCREKYKNIKLGFFYSNIKKQITSQTSDMYIKLSTNTTLKENLDKYLQTCTHNTNNPQMSINDKMKLLFQFVDTYLKLPKLKEEYNGIQIGRFYNSKKAQVVSNTCKMYVVLSEKLIIKNNLDEYLIYKQTLKNQV